MIGTTAAARAVALGIMKASTVAPTIPPMTTWLVQAPARERTSRAIRRSRPVIVMAAARKRAAATRISTELEKPLTAVAKPFGVPIRSVGSATARVEHEQSGDHNRADSVVEGFGNRDHDREAENRERALACDG